MFMAIHPKVKIGHIHLTVSNIDKSLDFYNKLLGFEITTRFGDSAVFLSAGGYHHHIGLNTWQGEGIPPQPMGYAGLYHFAILYPERYELAKVVKKLNENKYPLEGASDHGVSEAIYLRDPDNIGIELYWDRPKSAWPKDNQGNTTMYTEPLDLDELLQELKKIKLKK